MKKQELFKNIAIVFVVLAIMVVSLIAYTKFLSDKLGNEIVTTMSEISTQSVRTINSEINAKMSIAREVALDMRDRGIFEGGDIQGFLAAQKEKYGLKHFGIAYPNGQAMIDTGEWLDLTNRQYLGTVFVKSKETCDIVTDHLDNKRVISFAAPLVIDGNLKAAVFGVSAIEDFRRLTEVHSFGGNGYSYVVASDGSSIVDSENPKSFDFSIVDNLFDNMNNASPSNSKVVSKMRDDFALGKSDCVTFLNKVDKYIYYMPIGVNDWYIAHVVPKNVLYDNIGGVLQKTYILCIICGAAALFVCLYLYKYTKKRNMQLDKILYTDPVTGGLSHAKFLLDAERSLNDNDRQSAILSIDLDNFRLVNEIFGRETGDVLLWFIHSSIATVLPRDSVYARGMGDRFYALVYYNSNQQLIDIVETLCEYIVRKAPERFESFILKPCVGIYKVEDKEKNFQEMLNAASFAKNSLKHINDGQRYTFYTDEHRNQLLSNKHLSDEMEVALKNNEFVPYFQPQYDTRTRMICGAEALMRWRKKDGTIVSPGHFIPLAEKNGFISKLDENMFLMVCRYQREIIDSGVEPVPVSVNMSRQLLYDNAFIDRYLGIMELFKLTPDLIDLEVTETALFENQERFSEIVTTLREKGFKIHMDDFGTGYSSLMTLKSIPIDAMKLDKTFIDDYDDEKGVNIIKCVMALARLLNIKVIAEGVEVESQYKLLRELRCDIIQGFYFSRPVQFIEFKNMLRQREIAMKRHSANASKAADNGADGHIL